MRSRAEEQAVPRLVTSQPFGSLAITGLSTVGGSGILGPPTPFHLQNRYTAADDLFYSRSKHALKLGLLINRYNHALTAPTTTNGSIWNHCGK